MIHAVTQTRCPYPDCDQEQYGPTMPSYSAGEISCHLCKRPSAAMTRDQMLSIRRTNISLAQTPYTCTECGAIVETLQPLLEHLRRKHPGT